MWDLIVSVSDQCLSFYFNQPTLASISSLQHVNNKRVVKYLYKQTMVVAK